MRKELRRKKSIEEVGGIFSFLTIALEVVEEENEGEGKRLRVKRVV